MYGFSVTMRSLAAAVLASALTDLLKGRGRALGAGAGAKVCLRGIGEHSASWGPFGVPDG